MKITNQKLLSAIDEQVDCYVQLLKENQKPIKVCITITAKNEEDYLLDTLDAIINQKDHLGYPIHPFVFEVILLCHNCTDNTYTLATSYQKSHPEFNLIVLTLNSSIINNVGAARRVLMNLSLSRLQDNRSWIITTDADTIPSEDWIYNIISQNTTIDMVCGKILVNTKGLDTEVIQLLDAKIKYNELKTCIESMLIPDEFDTWPRHNQNSGPNLAIRKYAYIAVGGIQPIEFLEDVQLYEQVKIAGFVIKHDHLVVVTTSGRLFSKTKEGFGSELNFWTKHSVKYKVENLNTLLKRIKLHLLIKQYFENKLNVNLLKIASLSKIDYSAIVNLSVTSINEQDMILKFDKILDTHMNWHLENPRQNIDKVNKELEDYINTINPSIFDKG